MRKFFISCTSCFSGLSTSSRIKIINLLQEKGQLSVLEIARHFQLTQPTITHHLQYLKTAGILSSQKKGRKVFYFIDPKCKRKECRVFA
ncbi:MAG: ArsR/SmtB family transcription factor [Patescibacteria group bacterium]